MFQQVIIPVLVLCVTAGLGFCLIGKGEVLDACKDFWTWSKTKLQAVNWVRIAKKAWLRIRDIRLLINAPFSSRLHKRTKGMTFALGQVWVGRGQRLTIIGKTSDRRWVFECKSRHRKTQLRTVLTSAELREHIHESVMYLYDMSEDLKYTAKKVQVSGIDAVIFDWDL